MRRTLADVLSPAVCPGPDHDIELLHARNLTFRCIRGVLADKDVSADARSCCIADWSWSVAIPEEDLAAGILIPLNGIRLARTRVDGLTNMDLMDARGQWKYAFNRQMVAIAPAGLSPLVRLQVRMNTCWGAMLAVIEGRPGVLGLAGDTDVRDLAIFKRCFPVGYSNTTPLHGDVARAMGVVGGTVTQALENVGPKFLDVYTQYKPDIIDALLREWDARGEPDAYHRRAHALLTRAGARMPDGSLIPKCIFAVKK